jgi:hypothetical protein
MSYDERDPHIAKQELLEAMLSSMGGPVCAPMPGTLFELLEIAAMEHRHGPDRIPEEPALVAEPLTSRPNRSGMAGWLLDIGKTVVDVAVRFRAGPGPGRLPV